MSSEMKSAVDFLYGMPRFTKKNSLEHTRQLMRLLGSPCLSRKVIHIAGSNGKGSVSSFLYHMLLAGGKSTALFTSPHLVDIRERFQMNGNLVDEKTFLAVYKKVRAASNELVQKTGRHPTFFEFLFAMGMVIFEQADVEYIVLETGLGGRLDATNSFPAPVLSVITSISLEHTEYLGDTIAKIAAEKAGILKSGVPVVFLANETEAEAVIRGRAAELGCPCAAVRAYEDTVSVSNQGGNEPVGAAQFEQKMFQICEIKENHIDFFLWNEYHEKMEWRIPFSAPYQAENAAVAVTAMQMLNRVNADRLEVMSADAIRQGFVSADACRQELVSAETIRQGFVSADACRQELVSADAIRQGLLHTRWPGRMQQILPDIYFDGAHNPSGISAFVDSVRALAKDDAEQPMLLFSMVRDKDIKTSVSLLAGIPWDAVAVTAIPDERKAPVAELAQTFAAETGRMVETYVDYREAWQVMRQKKRGGQKLFCTGSLYFVGVLLSIINETKSA